MAYKTREKLTYNLYSKVVDNFILLYIGVAVKGITTISTDFYSMGKILATMITDNSKLQIENECKLIIRNSL